MATPNLTTLGWNAHWQDAFAASAAEGLVPARVSLEHQHIYTVCTGEAEILATVAGRFRHRAAGKHEFPAVGDWVALKPRTDARARATIDAVLPRTSRFSRKAAGDVTEEQVVAANIDVVFLVSGLDHDFNPRRIERYLVTAWDGGATPVIILNKADLCDDVAGASPKSRPSPRAPRFTPSVRASERGSTPCSPTWLSGARSRCWARRVSASRR